MNATRRLKGLGKYGVRKLFEAGQYIGLDILPRHYYSEIPDIRHLSGSESWRHPYSMVGVSGSSIDEQLAFVESCCPGEVVNRLASGDVWAKACRDNGTQGYGKIEADFLFAYTLVRRPTRITQVGGGVSTAVVLEAARESGYEVDLTCIDPYPNSYLRSLDSAGEVRLEACGAETVPQAVYDRLEGGDLLFVDSTHAVRPGGEVNRIALEILPRLPKGTMVHFHDINFPYNYPRGLLDNELFFNHESVLLHAFLACNSSYSLRVSFSILHYKAAHRLKAYFPAYQPAENDFGLRASPGHFPSSVWIEAVK